jgi:hypothetical protein
VDRLLPVIGLLVSYDQSLGGLTVDKEDNITVQSRGKIQKKKKEKRGFAVVGSCCFPFFY